MRKLIAAAAVTCLLAGCAKDVNGNLVVSPAAQPYVDLLAPLAWTVGCTKTEAAFAKIKNPSSTAVAAMGGVAAACNGPAPTDLASAKATLATAMMTFAAELAAGK